MNLLTGEIISEAKFKILSDKFPDEIQKYIPINKEQYEKLKGLNRKGRRAYFATHRKEFIK